jgi:hypothetical protein
MMRTTIAATALTLCCTGSSTPVDESNPRTSVTDDAATARVTLQDSPAMSNCAPTLASLLRKELATLPGMPADCTLDALAAHLQIDGQDRRGILGKAGHPSVYRGARADGYDETVKVWHKDGVVRKLSLDLPKIPAAEALITTLGAPDAKLDFFPSTVPKLREKGAWVYAARGLTLFLSGDGKNVVRFEVYPPTTAEAYERDLFHTEAPRERP